jgi:hypothetical protein
MNDMVLFEREQGRLGEKNDLEQMSSSFAKQSSSEVGAKSAL